MSLARARRSALWLPLALSIALSQPASAAGPAAASEFQSQLVALSAGEVASFYAHRADPLWTRADGTLDPAATELVRLVETADEDGLSPAALHASELAQAVGQAQSNPTPAALAQAEALLSRTFVAYANALRQDSGASIKYESVALAPHAAGAYLTLDQAAKAPSLAEYVRDMRWMHPLYAPLRRALMDDGEISPSDRQFALKNLERIRAIPAQPTGRHIVIDAANATLWMYEGDQVVDSMKVIVGKPDKQTPAYAGYIRYAIVNPYWNVPDDLVRSLIARNVLTQGMGYLTRQGYEVVSAWSNDAEVIDPHKIDWGAVRSGGQTIFVRQRPGPVNSMGKVKYEFPNVYGIYLHDTPERDLLDKDARQLSSGCIRLEDAKRLGQWLMEGDIEVASSAPEQKVDLPRPVPLYVTYLTARAEGGRVAVSADPYARDRQALAALD
jgi:murein L,D-transpeptidase YcbB/YkuD